ncbi:MAG: hypothetical protein HC800_14695 [Phormidesmis sp. RL_2_1]|nr:hypothetical protein [Phormidesmis sp. RL_2_1]
MIFNIFAAWWRKIQQDPTGWGALLLFAIGLIALLSIMRAMPYASV